jgi:L-ascorbate metabolism protein UlaG (beta-lactamase superfamily)
MKIIWLGHAAFRLETAKATILIDPFLTGNPGFAGNDLKDAAKGVTHILLTHGHGDHVGDTAQIARETGAVVLANADLAGWLGHHHGLDKLEAGNTGGTISLGGFRPLSSTRCIPRHRSPPTVCRIHWATPTG